MSKVKIIRATNTNKEYQYSAYKIGWILEVINDFGEYYTANVLTENQWHTDSVIAVHKDDCKVIKNKKYENKLCNTRL